MSVTQLAPAITTGPVYTLPDVPHTIQMVTPGMAEKWLRMNVHNRPLKPKLVDKYIRDIRQGRWQFNGDPVRISATNVLLDGQHRLKAILATGIAVPCLVVWKLPDEVQDTMDIGSRRTMADQLGLAGETATTVLGSVLRKLVQYYAGDVTLCNYNPTHREMREFLDAHPEVRFSSDIAKKAGSQRLPCTQSTIGAAHFICAQIDREWANRFYLTQLVEGYELRQGDPAGTLRRRIKYEADHGKRMSATDVIRYAFLAWNADREGRALSKLQAPKGGWGTGAPTPK